MGRINFSHLSLQRNCPRGQAIKQCTSHKIRERLTRHIIPEKFRGWIIRTVLFPLETTREGLKVFKNRDFIFYPFQNLNLLSGWRTANYILPLMVVIVNFPSAKSSRVSKPQCRRVSKFISMANLVNFFSRKL